MLEKKQTRKKLDSPVSNAEKVAPTASAKDASTADAAGPSRQRRKPRKLNKEPASIQTTTSSSNVGDANEPAQPASTIELEALKSRVRGLEAKVEELYKAAEARTGRSPRRRGKGRKGSSTQVPTDSGTTPATETAPPAPADDEELERLEDELEVARRDLESFRPRTRPRTRRSPSSETVEEIPRAGIGGVDNQLDTGDRQITLTGSYRIPLPSSVSMADVKSIQSGVSAAQNVAKSFLEQRRAAQAAPSPAPATPRAGRKGSGGVEVSREHGGQTWGEWFGGYSMAISRAVKNIEAEAAIEGQRQAGQAERGGGRGAERRGQRPGMRARQANLSAEQAKGLMS